MTQADKAQSSEFDGAAFLHRLIDALPLRMAYVDCDRRYRFANRLHCEHAGLSPQAIVAGEAFAMSGDNRMLRLLDLALAGEPQAFEREELVGLDRRIFEHRFTPDKDSSGRVRGVMAIAFDVTERAQSQRALQRQGATLSSITEAVPDVIMVVDRESRLRFVNGAFERWHGDDRARLLGRPLCEALGDKGYLRARGWVQRALGGETVTFDTDDHRECAAVHLSNTYIPLRLPDGRLDGFVGIAQDITRQRKEQARLTHIAHRDPLTGVLNRAGFDKRMRDLLLDPRRASRAALLYIDLDHFKPVNDQHGHPAGDELLRLVAQRLQHLVRPVDAVARLGGDEFAILLDGMREPAHAIAVADEVLAAAHETFDLGSIVVHIGASVGVACGPGSAEQLAARADAALYEAKRAGRGVVRLAS